MKIGCFYDFDLTLSEEAQQYPIFRKFMPQLKNKYGITKPEEYWNLCTTSKIGVGWMQQVAADAKDVFSNLTNKDLLEIYGKQIQLAPGIPQWFSHIKEYAQAQTGCILENHIISLGVKELILGSGAGAHVESVSAGQFLDDGKGIYQIKDTLEPFEKVKYIKEICKGAHLHADISWEKYNILYKNVFLFGDGQSDKDMFRYILQRGGIPVAVFEKGNRQEYEALVNDFKNSVVIIAPRDYRQGSILDSVVKKYILWLAEAQKNCDMDTEIVHNYYIGHIFNEDIKKVVEKHIAGCQWCKKRQEKHFYFE